MMAHRIEWSALYEITMASAEPKLTPNRTGAGMR